MKAKDVMSRSVITVNKDTTVKNIASLLSEHGIRAVPVVDSSRRVIGIVAEGDLVARLRRVKMPQPLSALAGRLGLAPQRELEEQIQKISAVSAEGIMTSRVVTVTEETPVAEIAGLLLDLKINQVPVVDAAGHLVGIVSRADVVRAVTA